jgi:hypothetical protein
MLEKDNLQNADGQEDTNSNEVANNPTENSISEIEVSSNPDTEGASTQNINDSELIESTSTITENEVDKVSEEPQETTSTSQTNTDTDITNEDENDHDDDSEDDGEDEDDAQLELDHVGSIAAANAEDSEDETNAERHEIEDIDYHTLSIEQLVKEFENLVASRKIQTIRKPINEIKSEFNQKYKALHEEKKEEFVNDGGNEIDFYFQSDVKKSFNDIYRNYKAKLNAYHKELEQNLNANLENRLHIIEEIKGLINVEENINTTYKHFKDLQEQWRNAGPIPRNHYNDVWNTYHHHVEIFYDFLHLNRDLRDMDFKHNLEEKKRLIKHAEELSKIDDINLAFRELQLLHKVWKEELGPVDREYRDDIWEQFSAATKLIHDKRQDYLNNLENAFEDNLLVKKEIISKIEAISKRDIKNHNGWQQGIKEVEALREAFFKAGRVPRTKNQESWNEFKAAVRTFNRAKNAFYKGLKKDQFDNLQKKLDLIKIAEDNKDSTDFETVTALMKNIQNQWKDIGHVPRKDSNKVWKQFKAACNHYFDRLHEKQREADKEFYEAFDRKNELLKQLKAFELTEDIQKDKKEVQEIIDAWKAAGHVPNNKRFIEGKFNKVLDGIFKKLKVDTSKAEMIKYENKLEALANPEDTRALDNERTFIRKKIDEIKAEINQLENNLMFFSDANSDNPLVQDVHKNIAKQKDVLETWKQKLSKLKGMY